MPRKHEIEHAATGSSVTPRLSHDVSTQSSQSTQNRGSRSRRRRPHHRGHPRRALRSNVECFVFSCFRGQRQARLKTSGLSRSIRANARASASTMFCSARSAMRRFASTVLLPTCGVRMTFGERAKVAASLHRCVRLAREHIERGSGETALRQRHEQRGLVDDRSARGVDQPGALAELRQTFAIDEMDVVAARRHVQTDEIRTSHGHREIIQDLDESAPVPLGGGASGLEQPTTCIP